MGAYFADRGLVWTLRGGAAPKPADVAEHVQRLRALRGVQLEMGSASKVHPEIVKVLRTRIFAERPKIPLRVYLAESVDLSFLEGLPDLHSLAIEARLRFKNVGALAGLPKLRDVSIAMPEQVTSDILHHLPRALGSLALRPEDRAARQSPDLTPLGEMKRLSALFIESYGPGLDAILPRLTRLERLGLRSVKGLASLEPIAKLGELRALSLFGGGFTELGPLTALPTLRHLHLWNLQKITSLAPVADMRALVVFAVEALNGVRALPDMKRLSSLRAVRLASMKRLRDFRPFAHAPALEELVLANAEHQRPDDLAPVLASKTLARAGFGFFKKADEARMRALVDGRGIDVEIYRYPQLRGRYGFDVDA